jgi:hypothetical protein
MVVSVSLESCAATRSPDARAADGGVRRWRRAAHGTAPLAAPDRQLRVPWAGFHGVCPFFLSNSQGTDRSLCGASRPGARTHKTPAQGWGWGINLSSKKKTSPRKPFTRAALVCGVVPCPQGTSHADQEHKLEYKKIRSRKMNFF